MTAEQVIEPWEPREELYLHSHFSEPLDGLEREGLDGIKDTQEIVRMLMKAGPELNLDDDAHSKLVTLVREVQSQTRQSQDRPASVAHRRASAGSR